MKPKLKGEQKMTEKYYQFVCDLSELGFQVYLFPLNDEEKTPNERCEAIAKVRAKLTEQTEGGE